MASRGTLHIVRNFHELDKSGVYDVAFTLEDGHAGPPSDRIRRFFGEQELTDFLKKHLQRNNSEVEKMMQELERSGHARIIGIELPEELSGLRDAA